MRTAIGRIVGKSIECRRVKVKVTSGVWINRKRGHVNAIVNHAELLDLTSDQKSSRLEAGNYLGRIDLASPNFI